MKTVYGKVSCEYWKQYRDIEAEVKDDATQDEIDKALREVAIERSGFEFWQVDDQSVNGA